MDIFLLSGDILALSMSYILTSTEFERLSGTMLAHQHSRSTTKFSYALRCLQPCTNSFERQTIFSCVLRYLHTNKLDRQSTSFTFYVVYTPTILICYLILLQYFISNQFITLQVSVINL